MAMSLQIDALASGTLQGDSMVVEDPETPRTIRTSGPPEELVVPGFDGERAGAAPIRVWMHPLFVNTYVVLVEPHDLIVVDPGLTLMGARVVEAAREWLGEERFQACRLDTVIYTHGHADHAFGTAAWVAAGKVPRQIIAHENIMARFDRYVRTRSWNGKINKVQFSLGDAGEPETDCSHYFNIDGLVLPTVLYRESLTSAVGPVELQLQHHKGETDDATVVFLPQYQILLTGDLVIWQACNCGNPQKVQRYCRLWAHALQWMASLGAALLLPGHGFAVRGADAIKTMLLNTSRYLLHLEDTTVRLMNQGLPPEAIAEQVQPDPDLARLPYLVAGYDHPSFIVRNILRLYGGWWNGDPATLMPAPAAALAAEIVQLAGGIDALVARGQALRHAGQLKLAAHLASFATKAAPDHRGAQELKQQVFEELVEAEPTLMAQGIYRYAAAEAAAHLPHCKL